MQLLSHMSRIIGQYTGTEPGPLVIVVAAMHGNEPAGVYAMQEVFYMLEREHSVNPGFVFKGKIIGLIGNLQAFSTLKRFQEKDLNRMWNAENVARIRLAPEESLHPEERELLELDALIRGEMEDSPSGPVYFLDLHTTSAEGGIFSIPTDDEGSLLLAENLHAPVILGLLDGVEGTLLQYYNRDYDSRICGVAFEGGQHNDPNSVSRIISAVINCLRSAGCVRPEDVDNRHDALLRSFSDRHPKRTRLFYVHHIKPEDHFKMRPGYVNFQRIREGEHLADERKGSVLAPKDCLILMPLYQPQGSDGFFLVEEN